MPGSVGIQHNTTDLAELILLVRKDAVETVGVDNEYLAIRADKYGALRTVLPGVDRDEGRTAATHDAGVRRVLEEILLALCEIKDALNQGR